MPDPSQRFFLILFYVLCAYSVHAGGAVIDVEKADADFAIQGEYTGELNLPAGKTKTGVQVIARGKQKFHAELLNGGLPGDGWDKGKKQSFDGEFKNDATKLTGAAGTLTIVKDSLSVTNDKGEALGTLKRVVRESPVAGAKPPVGAVVLFDGTNLDAWQKGARMSEDKLLMQGVNSVKTFQSFTAHVEFKLPYAPEASGQGRGNSGFYMQSRYECQILDSFGLKGENNECGGIYTIKAPDVNMCFPPLSWQTYDIEYMAAKFENGKKIKNAVATIKHNGVTIHDNVELTHATTSAPLKEGPEPGPIHIQDHGNPVRFRNIWLLEKP